MKRNKIQGLLSFLIVTVCTLMVSCNDAEMDTTDFNLVSNNIKAAANVNSVKSVPLELDAIDRAGLPNEVGNNLKEFIKTLPTNPTAESKTLTKIKSHSDSVQFVYPTPQIKIHVPNIKHVASSYTKGLTNNTFNVGGTHTHTWEVVSMDLNNISLAKIFSDEHIEISGRIATDQFSNVPDSIDVIVYNVDRAPHGGSYSDTPMLLDWEEKSNVNEITNSAIQGIVHSRIKGYAKKVSTIIKEYVESESFWASNIEYVPKDPK